MPTKETYLVRGPDGRMASVTAHSVRGALKIYLAGKKLQSGSLVSVKPRGHGAWDEFRITR